MKKNTIKLNESQLKKIVVESVKRMLTEVDSRINKVNNIIEAEFGNLINLDSPVNGPEYYVNGNPETTWRQYLLFNLRHSFGLMTNADVQYLPTVARLAFSDEVGFDKRNDNGEQISKLNKVIQAFKLNPNFFLMAKNNPNMSLEDLYNRMGYMGTNMSESKLNKIVAESVKKVLKESDFDIDDFDDMDDDMPHDRDYVTPGDSLPVIDQEPIGYNRFKHMTKIEKLEYSLRNQIENKEASGDRYSLKDLAKDMASRFRMNPVEVFIAAKRVYKRVGAFRAIDVK